MTRSYDLIIIGGGSGGIATANRAAGYGARCLLIEQGPLGGTCVNLGCVPKKVMWHAAHQAIALQQAADYGFEIEYKNFDWSYLKKARDAYIHRLNDIYAHTLDHNGVEVRSGSASFMDANTVSVNGDQFGAQRILIATGACPGVPNIPGAELGITSDDFFALDNQPARVAIIGSGYIAVELAGVFNALGTEVTLIARKDRLLRDFDESLAQALATRYRDHGITIRWNSPVESLQSDREDELSVQIANGDRLSGMDQVLWAIGRTPNTRGLSPQLAGVNLDAKGFVTTDEWQSTNVPHIFAVGDITGRAPLTPVAIAAGRRLADRLFGGFTDRKLDYENIPTVVFAHPPIGTLGLTEAQARQRYGDAIKIYQGRFTPMTQALSNAGGKSLMKLITVGEQEKIIGCHIFGEGADEMLQGFAIAINMGATKADFDNTVAIHPTNAEELVMLKLSVFLEKG
ncbi:MAG: glutathione-disulfide reductase [Methylococcaceae bacterium]|nr:glutathione-disulfide reductase [Methylococcaceae bacterium]